MSTAKEGNYKKKVVENKNYFADMNMIFSSKEEAKIVVDTLKKKDKQISARIVEKKDNDGKNAQVFIFFDEETHKKIISGALVVSKIKPESSANIEISTQVSTSKRIKDTKKENQPNDATAKGSSSRSSSQLSRKKETSQKKQDLQSKPSEITKKEAEPERYFKSMDEVPAYLLSRVSRETQKIMKMGILQIQKEPKKNLEYMINTLRAAQINYDIRVQKEKEIIGFMNELCQKMNERVLEYNNQEAEIFYKKYVSDPMNKGKFNKLTNQLQSKGIDEVSYLIFKKIGGKAKKYPFTETLLIKKIKQTLEENFLKK